MQCSDGSLFEMRMRRFQQSIQGGQQHWVNLKVQQARFQSRLRVCNLTLLLLLVLSPSQITGAFVC